MWEGRRLAVVMPARNEASHIDAALRTLPAEVDMVVVVDDGSSDGTTAAVNSAERPYEVVLLQRGGQGVGAAVAMGFDHLSDVLDADDLVAVMDGDGQMDPNDLMPLCHHLVAEQADVVKGDRLAHPEVKGMMPLLRRVANRGLAVLTTLASGRRVGDAQCGFSAHMPRKPPTMLKAATNNRFSYRTRSNQYGADAFTASPGPIATRYTTATPPASMTAPQPFPAGCSSACRLPATS